MLTFKIAATVAVVSWIIARFFRGYGDPFPNGINWADWIWIPAGLTFIIAAVTAIVALIWSILP